MAQGLEILTWWKQGAVFYLWFGLGGKVARRQILRQSKNILYYVMVVYVGGPIRRKFSNLEKMIILTKDLHVSV